MVLTAHRRPAPTSSSAKPSWRGLGWALGWALGGAVLISALSPAEHLGAVLGALWALGGVLFLVGCLLVTCRGLDLPVFRSTDPAVSPRRRLWSVMALSALMAVGVCALVQVVGLELTEDRVVAAMVVGLGVALSRCLGTPLNDSSGDGMEGGRLRGLLLGAVRSAWRIAVLWLRMALVVVACVQIWSLTVLPVAAVLRPWWYDHSDTLRLLGALPASAPSLVLTMCLGTLAHRRIRALVRDRLVGQQDLVNAAPRRPRAGRSG